jgi:uncharacterized membrane protein YccC
MNVYDEILSGHAPKEREELLRRFFHKHRDFRDSVQVPHVVSIASGIVITSLIVAILNHPIGIVVTCVLMIGYCFALQRLLERKLSTINKGKLEAFLKEIGESEAAPKGGPNGNP